MNETDKNLKRNLWMFPLGTVGRDMLYQLFNNFLLVYVLFTRQLTAAQLMAITAIMVAARIFDALNDPIMGNIIERTRTHWGKYKPWQAIGIVLTSLVIYLAFNVRLQGWPFVIFFGVIYFCYSIAYTMHDISYWGMIPSLGSDGGSRDQLTSRATLFAGVGSTLAGMLVPMLTTGSHTLGGSAQNAYGLVALMFCILGPAFFCFTIFGVKEDRSYMDEAVPPVSFRKIWGTLTGNDQLLWIALIFLLQQIGNGLALGGIGSTYIYFAFGYEGGLYSLFSTIGVAATAVLMIFYPAISRKWARKQLMKFMTAAASIGYAVMLLGGLLLPYTSLKFWLVTICYMVTNLGQYCFYLIMMISIINTVEYNEYKHGVRDEAIIASLRPFLTKLASALIVLFTTGSYLIFGVTGYTNRISQLEQMASQGILSEADKLSQITGIVGEVSHFQTNGLLCVMSLLPWVCMVASYVLYCKHYILDETEYKRIVGILQERKQK